MIKLLDASFPNTLSMSAKGENINLKPKHFQWYRGNDYHPICFFTDSCVQQARNIDAKIKVAWLLEPPPFRIAHYDYVEAHLDEFDYILTYRKGWIEFCDKALFYPYGGSMIAPEKWGIYLKTKLVSMIVSEKNEATGHKLRHEIARRFGDRIDILGSGYGPYVDKFEALRDYQYSIVVQGERLDWCFDEKLIDCFATGTVPIYWGCPSIFNFFLSNIAPFSDLDELGKILDIIEVGDDPVPYCWDCPMFLDIEEAKQYLCAEDWIYEHYPFLFEV